MADTRVAKHSPAAAPRANAPATGGLYAIIAKRDRLAGDFIRRAAGKTGIFGMLALYQTTQAALQALRGRPADLAIVGLTYSDLDGLDLIAALQSERLARRLLVLSGRRDERTRAFLRERRIGGHFDPKCEELDVLQNVIRAVMQGGSYFSAADATEAASEEDSLCRLLTAKELQVFVLLGGGFHEQAAADRLGVSRNTVHTHLERVMRKLGVQTRGQLMREALCRGYVRFTAGGILYPGLQHVLSEAGGCARE